MYFDYNYSSTQTFEVLIRNLLAQVLLSQNLVPPRIVELYNDSLRRFAKPDSSTFKALFFSVVSRCSTIFVLLDALDECSDEIATEAMSFVREMKESGVEVLCTSRTNTDSIRTQLGGPTVVEVRARDVDVANYVTARL